MTESQISSATKCCATCANWLGQRELRTWNGTVYLADDRTRIYGKCALRLNESGERHQAGSQCSNYEKWQALK